MLTNREVLQRVTGLDRKGVDLSDLFDSRLGARQDDEAEHREEAKSLNEPDHDPADTSRAEDDAYGDNTE